MAMMLASITTASTNYTAVCDEYLKYLHDIANFGCNTNKKCYLLIAYRIYAAFACKEKGKNLKNNSNVTYIKKSSTYC